MYLREDLVVPGLDLWLASLFAPTYLAETFKALTQAQEMDVHAGRAAVEEAARRALADCDQRLAKYRAGLEAGMEPGLVAQWTAEVRAQRMAAQKALRPPDAERHLTGVEVTRLVGRGGRGEWGRGAVGPWGRGPGDDLWCSAQLFSATDWPTSGYPTSTRTRSGA